MSVTVGPAEGGGDQEAEVEADRLAPRGGRHLDLHPGRAQPREAAAGDPRVGDRAWQATTRAMPAAITASAQGGVRPWWEQGSRVT